MLAIRRRVLGEEHPDTLSTMNHLATLYGRQGRYAEAEPLLVKTLEIQRRVRGAEHPETLRFMNNLGDLAPPKAATPRPSRCWSRRWRFAGGC